MGAIIGVVKGSSKADIMKGIPTEARADAQTIEPLVQEMAALAPVDLIDFCKAVCDTMQKIEATRNYQYFTDSTRLACLIGGAYTYKVEKHPMPDGSRLAF